MASSAYRFIKPVVFLLILCLLFAGCTSKTDIQPAPATPVPVPTKFVQKVINPSPATQTPVPDDGSKTCSQLQGTVALPGQVCPGIWLTATDSFSCCSKPPVAGKITTARLVVEPLDLRITHNDSFIPVGTG